MPHLAFGWLNAGSAFVTLPPACLVAYQAATDGSCSWLMSSARSRDRCPGTARGHGFVVQAQDEAFTPPSPPDPRFASPLSAAHAPPFVVLNSGRDIGKAESQIAIAVRVVSQCHGHIEARDANPIVRHPVIDIEAIGCANIIATINA